jgi:hypothetical protein
MLRILKNLNPAASFDSANQTVEAVKRSVYHFQSLLSNICVQQTVILVLFTQMVNRFVTQVFVFLKVVLPKSVQPHVIEVFAEAAQLS